MRFVATGSWLLSATVDTCLLPLKSLSNLCRPHSSCLQPFNNCRLLLMLLLLLLLLLQLLLLLLLLLPVCCHCHCDVCLISQFISCQTACQCRLSFYGVVIANSRLLLCLRLRLGLPVYLSHCHRKSEKPKETPVKTLEFDVLTVCPRLALCLGCLAYATTS